MRLLAMAVVAVAALAGCSLGADEDSRRERIFELGTYFHAQEFEAALLRAVDPETLLPVGRSLQLGDSVTSRVLSPDRRTFAFGGTNFGELVLVDAGTMRRRVLRVTRERYRSVLVLSWPRRNLLVAASCRDAGKWGCFDEHLWLIDPTSPRRQRSMPLPSLPDSAYDPATGRTVGLIAGFRGGIRSTWLLVVEPDGRLRRIGIRRVPAGVDARRQFGAHYVGPSLALDSRRGIAVVVGPRSPVAELDLRTLRVRYRRVHGLDPSEAEITRDGPREWTGTHNPHSTSARDASVLRPGLIRVDVRESRLVDRWAVSEFGRSVVLDTHRWRVRRLRPTESVDRVGDLMLVNSRPQGKAFPPFRLEAYDRFGKRRYRIDGAPRRLFTWELGAGLLYAGRIDGTMTHVFDASNGKLLRRIPPREFDFQFEQPVFRWVPPQA